MNLRTPTLIALATLTLAATLCDAESVPEGYIPEGQHLFPRDKNKPEFIYARCPYYPDWWRKEQASAKARMRESSQSRMSRQLPALTKVTGMVGAL